MTMITLPIRCHANSDRTRAWLFRVWTRSQSCATNSRRLHPACLTAATQRPPTSSCIIRENPASFGSTSARPLGTSACEISSEASEFTADSTGVRHRQPRVVDVATATPAAAALEAFLALKDTAYARLRRLSWAYAENERMLYVQTVVNSDIVVVAEPAARGDEWRALGEVARDGARAFTDDELSAALHAALRLHVAPDDDLVATLLLACLDRLDGFGWPALRRVCESASMLKRCGFPVHSRITASLQRRVDAGHTRDLTLDSLAGILLDTGYFLSEGFLSRLLAIAVAMVDRDAASMRDMADLLEGAAHFAPRGAAARTLLEKMAPALIAGLPGASALETAKVALYAQIGRGARHGALGRELENRLAAHAPEFDVMLLKHCARSLWRARAPAPPAVVVAIARRVVARWPDVAATLSCLRSVLRLLARPPYRLPWLESFLRDALADELRRQRGASPLAVSAIAAYLAPSCHRDDATASLLRERVAAMRPQLRLPQVHAVLQGFVPRADVRRRRRGDEDDDAPLASMRRELVVEAIGRCGEIENAHALNSHVATIAALLRPDDFAVAAATLMQQYRRLLPTLQPQQVARTCYLLARLGYRDSVVMETLTRHVAGDDVEDVDFGRALAVMKMLGKFGYQPEKLDALLRVVMKLFENDDGSISAMDHLQLANALTELNLFPEVLARKIFSLPFVMEVDKHCESVGIRQKSSEILQRTLMKLNRCVVLDFPQYAVPWFHDLYCQYYLPMHEPRRPLKLEVEHVLAEALGGVQFYRANTTSQYYHRIDFEFVLDGKGQPMPVEHLIPRSNAAALWASGEDAVLLPPDAQRVAMNVTSPAQYCSNENRLLAQGVMKWRHLEMLGYRVVQVSHFEWNSMSLCDPVEKARYLRRKVFARARKERP
ncbi:PREDICTED: uncharacterized protein LOC106816969 [Priapulus caudatus]|uniref:Uncharacterized protein LOC106816969 n=1 Tax=Priapulus caudatus TaxID=37621 RepID=A0ABM1EY30_PRICU|nr:PREDICTED: uncharacterized protein LOC106816969 [Priapulus caudatus]